MKKKAVGIVSKELQEEILEIKEMSEFLDRCVQQLCEALQVLGARKVIRDNKIREELGLEEGPKYEINDKTGEVYLIEEE